MDRKFATDVGELLRIVKTDTVLPASVDPPAGEIYFGFDINGIPCFQDENGVVQCIHAQESGGAFGFATIALLPQPAAGNSTPGSAQANGAAFGVRGISIFNFDLLSGAGVVQAGELIVSIKGSSAGTEGEIRLFNRTDGQDMGTIAMPAGTTAFTLFTTDLINIPATGRKIIEIQMRRSAGGGNIQCEAAVVEMVQEAP